MTFTELSADISIMREGNEDTFALEDYSDSRLAMLMATSGKKELKVDLTDALSIEPDDATTLDAITDTYSARLAMALAYKQLHLYFVSIDMGESSKSRTLMLQYENRYNQMKSSFITLKTKTPTTSLLTRIKR